jgi:organic radical activating enzyme
MTTMYRLDENVQIYITNVCNLTCENCITYNNLKFKGHYYFKDYEAYFKEWSKKLELNSLTIIGGEPFTNPKLIDWTMSIKSLWPNLKEIDIATNGTYLKHKIKECQELLRQNIWLDINVHDPSLFHEIEENLKEIFSIFKNIRKEKSSEYCDIFYIGSQKIAKLDKKYVFSKKSLRSLKNNIIYMHDSDPSKSHGECGYCYTFMEGRLYKCFLTAVSKPLCNQFEVEPRAKELLLKYKSCSPFDQEHIIKEWIENLPNPIEQCRLCTETNTVKQIWPLSKLKTNLV